MYRFRIHFLLSSVFLILLYSCGLGKNSPEAILSEADKIVDLSPDSALFLLETIANPENLDEKEYNRYLLLNVKAKDKDYRDIAGDTLVFRLKDFYLKKGDTEKAAIASFYAGRIHYMRKDLEKAVLAYLDAENLTQKSTDYNLRGLIQYDLGEINYGQVIRDESISRLKHSAHFFDLAGNYKNEILSYNGIGMNYQLQSQQDSAFYYYEKALSIAAVHKDSLQRAYVMQNIGVIFVNQGSMGQARSYFRQALRFLGGVNSQVKTYLNIARTFDIRAEKDSLTYYVDKSLQLVRENPDSSLSESGIYKLLAGVEEGNNNYQQALVHQKKYLELIDRTYKDANNKAILDIQKKYNFELIRNENNRLLIQRLIFFLVALVLLVGIMAVWFFSFRKDAANRSALLEAEQKYYQLKVMADGLKEEASSADEKEMMFRDILSKHFDILKKAALLEGYLKDDERKQGQKLLKKFNEIVYEEENLVWDKLYEAINYLYNHFPEKLKEKYPQLDENDIKLCCLTKAGLSNTEISIIVGFTLNTVQMKKTTIRKKLGIDGYGNFVEFLNQNID